MTKIIEHAGDERDVTASGGTLSQETTFYRNEAELTNNYQLTLPTSDGNYMFTKDPQDSMSADLSEISSFYVGPIFHLPEDTDESDEMRELIYEHSIVLLLTLVDENGTNHFLHFFLENNTQK